MKSELLSPQNFAAQIPSHDQKLGLKIARCHFKSGQKMSVPGSKSFTNRAVVLAGMSTRPVLLKGILLSDDSFWALKSLQSLGFGIEFSGSENEILVTPPIPTTDFFDTPAGKDIKIHLGMAGTLARFFPAVVLNFEKTFALNCGTVELTAEARLCARPLAALLNALKQWGANFSAMQLPLSLSSTLLFGKCAISGAESGQFLSGLLLTAAGSRNALQIERRDNLVQPDYVRMTLQALSNFGAEIKVNGDLESFDVYCPRGLQAESYTVEADASTACYFIALAVLHNFDLIISNIGTSTLQPDLKFADVLINMGACITYSANTVSVKARNLIESEPFLKGGFTLNMASMSDQSLTMAIVSLFAHAPVTITGVEHIRQHESDRIASLVANFNELAFNSQEHSDGFTVHPLNDKSVTLNQINGIWKTHHDHRFAMCGALLASKCHGVSILNPKCVEKTAPTFFKMLQTLGVAFESEFQVENSSHL